MGSENSKIISGTQKGLLIINIGLWIHLAAALLFTIAMVLALNGESSFTYVRYSNGAAILYLFFLFLFFIGFGSMFLFSKEFGNKHTYRVYLASIFMLIGFVIFFIFNIIFLSKNFSDLFIADVDFESRTTFYIFIFGLKDISWFFFHLMISIMWIFLVYELASKRQIRLLLFYFVISISISLIVTLITYLNNLEGLKVKYLIESSSFVGSTILIYCYGNIYKRIRIGEIKPVPSAPEFPPFFPFRFLNGNSQKIESQ